MCCNDAIGENNDIVKSGNSKFRNDLKEKKQQNHINIMIHSV